MGVLDEKAFVAACKKKTGNGVSKRNAKYDVEATLVLSKWEDEIMQPEWHPFKVIDVDGQTKVNLFILLLYPDPCLCSSMHVCLCINIFDLICWAMARLSKKKERKLKYLNFNWMHCYPDLRLCSL